MNDPVKLVSDFDGVLTNLTHEAVRVRELFIEELIQLGWSVVNSNKLVELSEGFCAKNPTMTGWKVKGRISAFSDEDPFVLNSAVGDFIDQMRVGSFGEVAKTVTPEFLELWSSNARTHERFDVHFDQVAGIAYNKMTQEVMKSVTSTPLETTTRPIIEGMMRSGALVTIISNSGSDRISDILKKSELASTTFPEVRPGFVCIRGGAKKFALGDERKTIEIGGRVVDVSRPDYEALIRQERPDAVIGDVFSLDLALPFALAQSEPELFPRGLKLILRIRDYTPSWSEKILATQSGRVRFYGVQTLDEVAKILAEK